MTAGTGHFHSEHNVSDDSVHFFQILVRQDKPGLTLSYDLKSFRPDQRENRLFLLAAVDSAEKIVSMNTNADATWLNWTKEFRYTTRPAMREKYSSTSLKAK